MKICAIIPSYNHHQMIGAIVQELRAYKLPVFIIDDGSWEPSRAALAALHDPDEGISLCRLPQNQGKGGAVIEGFRQALAAGFTHALQVDADGQHDLSVVPKMLALVERHPEALISGQPIYDHSVPMARKIGRWVTHIWVWIETLSFRISDSMCGFRIYPLLAVEKLLSKNKVGSRMDFDTDIMVRLFWQGVPPIMVPVRVVYPPNNTSNFDLWGDNLRISWMHTRLFCTMVRSLPSLLKPRPPHFDEMSHWSKFAERGAYWGVRLMAAACRLLGKEVSMKLLTPIVLYFYLTGRKQRHSIKSFLERVLRRPPTLRESFKPFINFLERSLDLFLAWTDQLPPTTIISSTPSMENSLLSDAEGSLIIVSHLGNANIAHALLRFSQRQRMTVLVHTHHAVNFNRLLNDVCSDTALNIYQVTDIGPETIIVLKQKMEEGRHIVIAGDRTSVLSNEHMMAVPFLERLAFFPSGPWILAALLDCPVRLLFCLKDGQHYRLTIEPFVDRVVLPRATRHEELQTLIARYAQRLEHYATENPFQWYNFFDFWARS